jgi:hypothetical protein
MIALVGAKLIHGAINPAARALTLTEAGASKLIFIVLVLTFGRGYLSHQAGVAVAVDLLWVVLFAWYLLRRRAIAA